MTGLVQTITVSTPRTLGVVALVIGVVTAIAVFGFSLTTFGALALYFVLWWTFLFAVLPLGNETESDPSEVLQGHDPGAPAKPRLREKALLTTLVASVAFFVALVVFPLARL